MRALLSVLEESVLFIEWLDTGSLFFEVIPYFLRHGRKISKTIFVFDASLSALRLTRCVSFLMKWKIELVRFELSEIRDQNNFSLRLRLDYFDIGAITDKITANAAFQNYICHFKDPQHLSHYLAKDFIEFDLTSLQRHRQILHAITLVNVSRWYLKNGNCGIKLFLKKRCWPEILQEYARDLNVVLVFALPFYNFAFDTKRAVRQFLARYVHWGIFFLRNIKFVFRKIHVRNAVCQRGDVSKILKYKLGVEYYGHLNLERKDAFSDLFFYSQSQLKGEEITLLFSLPQDPLDQNKSVELQKHDISALVRFPSASHLPLSQASVHDPWSVPDAWHLSDPLPNVQRNDKYFAILRKKTVTYNRQLGYWKDLFIKNNIRLYTHWYKYDAKHIPLADALKSLGGISALYQRAYESHPIRGLSIVSDVVFCYSKNNFAIEKDNRSDIGYQVVTGFLGDFRFPHLKEKALEIARPLREKGVKRIIAFLDENTLDDGRWFVGHAFTQRNYAYLIDKVLKDPRYGIIFKPKVSWNLRRRLGDVAKQLDELQKCGRGVILGGGCLQNMHPPALAALAADLTIHECLSAGSAGVEAALAGAPTLFLDTEGWPVSPFYQGGLGKVVFQDWPSLWQACEDFFEKPAAKASIGNCAPFLSEIDPFRDGRAAERMGTYLKWLLNGLNAGLPRQEVLADAAEKYTKLWGKDKIHLKN